MMYTSSLRLFHTQDLHPATIMYLSSKQYPSFSLLEVILTYLLQNYPHARVICEFGVWQDTEDLTEKCHRWLQQIYVRYVLEIKLYGKRESKDAQGRYHRSMMVCFL